MHLKKMLPDGLTIHLSPPTEDDIPRLYEAAVESHKELAPWMPWCHAEYSISDTESWVRETVASDSEHSFITLGGI